MNDRGLRDTASSLVGEDNLLAMDGGNPQTAEARRAHPTKEADARSNQVKNPHESKRVIEASVACLEATP